MNDSEFRGYCEIHYQTVRALFSPKNVFRLYMLAGRIPDETILELVYKERPGIDNFIAMHNSDIEFKELMELAKNGDQK